jgi:hypothetical protein
MPYLDWDKLETDRIEARVAQEAEGGRLLTKAWGIYGRWRSRISTDRRPRTWLRGKQLLDAACLRFTARLKSLNAAHSLVMRTRPAELPVIHELIKQKYQPSPVTLRTRLHRTDEFCRAASGQSCYKKRSTEKETLFS